MAEEGRKFAHGVEEIVVEMRAEFVEEAVESLQALELAIEDTRHEKISSDELAGKILKTAIFLKAQAAGVHMPQIVTLAHRMEDYLGDSKTLPPHAIDRMAEFIEMLLDVLEGRIEEDADLSALVRKLPAKATFDLGDIEVRNIEIMLVMEHGVATHFVERELQACGYRTSVVTDPFDAIPLIVRTKPELVIVSAVMPNLTGIDLAVGITSMPSTRNTPVAVITSLDADNPMLQLLPKKVPTIMKGPTFGDDLAEALDMLFLI